MANLLCNKGENLHNPATIFEKISNPKSLSYILLHIFYIRPELYNCLAN